MNGIPNQRDLMKNVDWDCLIVLDACRYDFFEKAYDDYLEGELRKVISAGSNTPKWLNGTFRKGEYEDAVYVSGNPMINSLGVEVATGFEGPNFFHKIIDVWDWGWDNRLQTVPPQRVRKDSKLAHAKHPGRRLIVHFNQPHHPYLSLGPLNKETYNPVERAKGLTEENSKLLELSNFLAKKLSIRSEIRKIRYRIKDLLNLRNPNELELITEKYGKETLRNVYEKNLKTVLKETAKLSEDLHGRICVTSDHGELLGEGNLYKHPPWCNSKLLRVVPWLETK